MSSQKIDMKAALVMAISFSMGLGVKLNKRVTSHPLSYCKFYLYCRCAVVFFQLP